MECTKGSSSTKIDLVDRMAYIMRARRQDMPPMAYLGMVMQIGNALYDSDTEGFTWQRWVSLCNKKDEK